VKLYISDGALWLLAIFYAPIVFWLLWNLWKKLSPQLPVKLVVTLFSFLIAAAVPLWDVVITSLKIAELCPHAGLFVKRSVNVDGFYTNFGSPDMLDRGFKYIESRSYGDRLVVYSKEGGTVKKEEFDASKYQVKSRYEFIYGSERVVNYLQSISEHRSVVRDRETNDELGYALRYAIYPGWVDRQTVARIGKVMWTCQAIPAQSVTLMERVLLPKVAD